MEKKAKCLTLNNIFTKEVVNACTGNKLGYVVDGEIDESKGIIKCLYVSEVCKTPFSRKKEIKTFSFNDILKIGDEIILIDGSCIQSKI